MSGGLYDKVLSDRGGLDIFGTDFDRIRSGLRARANVDDEKLERGLAQLVMTLIELLRQLMERQAVHRMAQGNLTPEEFAAQIRSDTAKFGKVIKAANIKVE